MPQPPQLPGDSTLFELLPIGAYRSSAEGRQLRANLALARMNGYAGEAELLAAVKDIGREWYVDPRRRAEFQQLMQRDGQVTDFVSEVYRHRTRERIWIRENAHLVRAEDGTALCYEGTVEDISAQHRAELALQASERRFRAFTERSQVLTVLCDADGRVHYVSPASHRLLGMEPEALRHSHVFDWLHADDVQRARAELQAVLGFINDEHETVWRVRHADGGWRHLAVLANNFLSDPAVAGVVLNIRDVSGRTRAEAELRALNAELEQRVLQRTQELVHARDQAQAASRAKSEFLSRMSHELRTPMHAILGFGQLLQGDAALRQAPVAASHLREILRAGDQLLGLIDQLLDLARLGAGELPAAPQAPAGTVLVIEDNPVNLLLMEAMLGQLTRCRMLGAELPETGLQLARAERPDLILLDIQLPGIDGYEVLRRLRAEPATRAIPVIAISANAMRADIERGHAAGFDDYLTKPIDQPLLLAALQRCLRHG
jgi:PAS domain S-box-containing protein